VADFFVAGVEQQIGTGFKWAVAPLLALGVKEFGALADLGGADSGPAEFLDDGGDFARGDSLDVHLGQGELERLFGADARFQGGGVEFSFATYLGGLKLDGPDAGGEGFGLEAVGMAGALIRLGFEDLGVFQEHGFIAQETDALGEAIGALFSDELQDGVQEFRLVLVGHMRLMLVVFGDTPTGNQYGPPSTRFSRAERPCPFGARADGRKTIYRKKFTPAFSMSPSQ